MKRAAGDQSVRSLLRGRCGFTGFLDGCCFKYQRETVHDDAGIGLALYGAK